jgi:ferredoxin-NADP reductase
MAWKAEGVLSLDLVGPSDACLPVWKPGAHIDIDLRLGLRRQYSLCGAPQDDRRWKVTILHEPVGTRQAISATVRTLW